jgi:Nif-specific regulatory protein
MTSGEWRDQQLLLMRELMQLVGRFPAPDLALRKMLHLMSELQGLNRGRIVLSDAPGTTARSETIAPNINPSNTADVRE